MAREALTLTSLVLRELPRDIVELGAVAELGEGFFFLGVFLTLGKHDQCRFGGRIAAFKLAYQYVPHVDAGGGLQLSAAAGVCGLVFLAATASFTLGALVACFGGLVVGFLAASHVGGVIGAELIEDTIRTRGVRRGSP